jgi:hypothetical protein
MIKKRMSLEDTLSLVSQTRYINPNDGFLEQLIELENELKNLD